MSEVIELVATTFEGTAWGTAGDRLVKVFKLIKNNILHLWSQTATTIAGSAI